VLQCVAVCFSVLQCVVVCCSVLQCVAVCCGVLQCIIVCCSVLQCVLVYICVFLKSSVYHNSHSSFLPRVRASSYFCSSARDRMHVQTYYVC